MIVYLYLWTVTKISQNPRLYCINKNLNNRLFKFKNELYVQDIRGFKKQINFQLVLLI